MRDSCEEMTGWQTAVLDTNVTGGNKISIASVTVARNAASSLARQLDSLRQQTRSLDEIVVVDNASTDDTLKLLANSYPSVTVLSQETNGGVGGGYSAGLSYAIGTKKHDWVWLLDDDTIPAPQALEQLLSGLTYLGDEAPRTAILAPVGVHPKTQAAYYGHMWRNGLRPPDSEAAKQAICFVDVVISSGSLVRKEAIEEVGLPRSDFFMDFVDYEHCLRMRRYGYKIAVVTNARMDHTIGDPQRRTLFGKERIWVGYPPWREYYIARNEVFAIWTEYPDWKTKYSIVRRLLRHAVGVALLGEKKRACLKMMFRGFMDGRAGRLGVRVLPESALGQSLNSTSPQQSVRFR